MKQLSFLLVCLMAFIGFACNSNNTQEQNNKKTTTPTQTNPSTTQEASQKRARIVFFGNSLTAGYQLDEAMSFPALIQKRIDSLGLDYESVNAGQSGDTTADGLARLDWVMEQAIDVFVLELGANDALRGQDLANTKKNLQSIIDKLKAKYPDAKIALAGMQAPPNMGSEYSNAFRAIYKDLAQDNQLALIPFLLEGVAAVPSLNLPDGVHPNEAGQKIVMENVWAVLKNLL